MTRQFAYGQNEVSGCECPLVAAGLDPDVNGPRQSLAGRFDLFAQNKTDVRDSVGVVDEATAKDVWADIVQFLRSSGNSEELDYATEVADELGWNDA